MAVSYFNCQSQIGFSFYSYVYARIRQRYTQLDRIRQLICVRMYVHTNNYTGQRHKLPRIQYSTRNIFRDSYSIKSLCWKCCNTLTTRTDITIIKVDSIVHKVAFSLRDLMKIENHLYPVYKTTTNLKTNKMF